jgi:1,3-propanediol dehydrogenase/alcohol dehydrogenase
MPAGREPTLVVYQFRLPEVTHFGWGAVEGVGQEAARLGRRALLVTGRAAMKQTGTADRVVALLAAAGLSVLPYEGIESDPRAATIDRAAKAARAEGCDLVVGLGGGSPMDAARAIAAMAVLEGSITDYLDGKAIDRPGLPLINIATTAGTASEITSVAVVLHERKQLKMGLKSPFWFARVAITDPELTLTMPPALTAATGLDALTHAIESYVSTQATPPSEGLALRAIELVGLHLRAAFADGSNRPAREGMALASMTAGMAFANSGLGLVHGLVHPIGARFGVPHGMACGRLLPLVMRYNQPAAEEKMAQVGRALTRRPEAEAQDAADAVESLLRDLGVPAGIGDVGVPADQIPSLARDGLLAGAVRTNPRSVTEQEALALLQQAARA